MATMDQNSVDGPVGSEPLPPSLDMMLQTADQPADMDSDSPFPAAQVQHAAVVAQVRPVPANRAAASQ